MMNAERPARAAAPFIPLGLAGLIGATIPLAPGPALIVLVLLVAAVAFFAIPYAAGFALVMGIPFERTLVATPLKAITLSDLLLLVGLAVGLAKGMLRVSQLRRHRGFLLLGGGYAIANLISLLLNDVPGPRVATELLLIVKLVALGLLVASWTRGDRTATAYLWAIASAGAIISLLTVYQFTSGTALGTDWSGADLERFTYRYLGVDRPSGLYGDPNGLAAVLAIIVPIQTGLIAHARKRWHQLAALVLAAPTIAALCITLSRAGMIGAAAGTVALVLLLGGWQRAIKVMLPLLLAPSVLALVGPELVTERLTSDLTVGSMLADGRLGIWAEMIDRFWQSPIIGYGSDNLMITQLEFWTNRTVAFSPHNLYLKVLIDTGILGFVLFVLLFVLSVRTILIAGRAASGPRRVLLCTVCAGLVAHLVHGGMDTFLTFYPVSGLAWTLIGMGLALCPARADLPTSVAAATAPTEPIRAVSQLRPVPGLGS